MSKRKLTTGALLLATTFVGASFVGCGGEKIEGIDPSKKQIYVSIFDGGFGTDWLDYTKKKFEAKYTDYQIIPLPSKSEEANVYATFQAGAPSADVYYTSGLNSIQEMITGNYLLDLSDVYSAKVEGETQTIEEKLLDADTYRKAFSAFDAYKDEFPGVYGLPFMCAINGFVYDHDLFENNGWLYYADPSDASVLAALNNQNITYTTEGEYVKFVSASHRTNYTAGDKILRAGKDGKYGTYDDGQPITEAEFEEMIYLIKAKKYKSFIWSGAFVDYTSGINDALVAQYEGVDNYKALIEQTEGYTYTGNTESLQGYTVTRQEGYELYKMDGLAKSVEFTGKYIGDNYHLLSPMSSTSHTDAQNNYLLSYKNDTESVAFLIEGIWWENEARTMFNTLESQNRGYGDRDYRYMLYPQMEGQRGIDGSGKGTVFSATDTGMVFAYNSSDKAKNEVVKEFIKMTTSDEVLKYYTKTIAGIRPFNYTLTDDELNEMSPFARAVWDINHDAENISILKKHVWYASSEFSFSGRGNLQFSSLVTTKDGPMTFAYPIDIYAAQKARNVTTAQYIEGIYNKRKNEWSTYLSNIERATQK